MMLESLWARGTPRRRTPIRAKSFVPPLFSTISWAKRFSVRPISSLESSCLFSTTRIGLGWLATVSRYFVRHPSTDRRTWQPSPVRVAGKVPVAARYRTLALLRGQLSGFCVNQEFAGLWAANLDDFRIADDSPRKASPGA